MEVDSALERLKRVSHIVVLMMENRSFDHMLGYLKTDGLAAVDGLTGLETNPDEQEQPVHVFPFPANETAFHRPGLPLDESLDPQHGASSVAEQLAGGNQGFVKNFIREKKPPENWRTLPMGHYTAEHLPVYDFLARRYCICDRWHSSVPSDTWPNRLYALAAREGDRIGLKLKPWEKLAEMIGLGSMVRKIEGFPIFEVEAFTRQLDDDQWRWYSHDPATLRAADKRYRNFRAPDRGNFAYFNRKEITLTQRALETPIVLHDSFLDDATKADPHGLRPISWIDPNFIDARVFDTVSNDDHPPSDIKAGQELVLETYHALVNSPNWENTLFVITYDEHGGFYDHVIPPPVPGGDPSSYTTFGVRVPALVIGPRVRNHVCHEFFDHTSLMKTILLRFAANPSQAIANMGPRVQRAQHLGIVLGDEPRTDLDNQAHVDLLDRLEQWRAGARRQRRASSRGEPAPDPDGAGKNWQPTQLQSEFWRFASEMRRQGLPPGQP